MFFLGPFEENQLNTTTNVPNVFFFSFPHIVMFTCAYIKKRELSSDFCLVFFFNSFLFNFLSKAIGVSNQRETTVVWDKLTGEPLYNAVGKLLCVDVKCKAFFYLQMWSC